MTFLMAQSVQSIFVVVQMASPTIITDTGIIGTNLQLHKKNFFVQIDGLENKDSSVDYTHSLVSDWLIDERY